MTAELTNEVKVVLAEAATAAGTTAIESAWIDTAGFEGCIFVTTALAIVAGAATSIEVQQAAVSDGTGKADLSGTSITIADDDDNQTFMIDVKKPTDRYLSCKINRATQNSAFGEIYAILYGPRLQPTTNTVADTLTALAVASPAEV